MIRKFFLSLFVVATTLRLSAQSVQVDSLFQLPDSARAFTIENFYALLIQNHPVLRQASLLSDVAKQEIRMARGGFDPKLETEYLLKHYQGTEYFRIFQGSLKLPTRSPVTPVIGLDRNKGEYLNPERYISNLYDYQQMYAGVSLPLGQGLMTDERRTIIRQAEIFAKITEAEQISMTNKLLLQAAKDYWDWFYSYYQFRLANNATLVAADIFRRVKMNFTGGEVAPVDTVQAKIIFIERDVSRQEAYLQWRNSSLVLETYLWDSLMRPLSLPPVYAPLPVPDEVAITPTTLNDLLIRAQNNHPDLRKISYKLEQLELDRSLAAEYLKPRLDLSYYLINQPFYPEGVRGDFAFDDNYKFGVDFSIPLFLRKERSKVALAKLKIASTTADQQLATRQIINDVLAAFNGFQNNQIILGQQRQMVENYHTLMNAERLNLESGESDLFKVNIQLEKLFNAQSKMLKVMSDAEKQKAVLYWSAGVRPLDFDTAN